MARWKMGVHELMEGKEVHGRRGVWQLAETEVFMYSDGSGKWLISNRGGMEAGGKRGWCCVVDNASCLSAPHTRQDHKQMGSVRRH